MTGDMAGAQPSGWDCHAHLFGPYARYPLAADRSYTPPEAPASQYLALLAGLGLSNGVLVHPSAYGDDFSLLLDALSAHRQLRGVVVVRSTPEAAAGASPEAAARASPEASTAYGSRASVPAWQALRDLGVRAARFSHRSGAGANFAGSASIDDLTALAPSLADAGLHAELWTDCRALPAIADRIRRLPVPVVIDHMGGFDPLAGVDDPGFQCLLSLVGSGRVWVKLCAYRNLLGVPDFETGEPFHRALLRANPQRLLWGSDWPHLRVSPAPDTAGLLQTFRRWTADADLVTQILERNPAALYA